MEGLFARLAALLWPERCAFCGSAVPAQEVICPRCRAGLPLVEGDFCMLCGREAARCVCRLGDDRPFGWLIPALWYTGGVRRAMWEFKFRDRVQLGDFFAVQMAKAMAQRRSVTPDCDILTCVPIPAQRLAQRGYNQAEILARALLPLLGRDRPPQLRPELLVHRGSLVQHSLPARQRRRAAKAAYALNQGAEDEVRGRRVLLVDDILTTGSTLRACAWQLQEAGAASVFCVAAAAARQKY